MTEQEFALRAQDQRGRLYRTAFLYLGGEHAAVDAVDEAVYRAFRDRRKLRQPEFFETWLTRSSSMCARTSCAAAAESAGSASRRNRRRSTWMPSPCGRRCGRCRKSCAP